MSPPDRNTPSPSTGEWEPADGSVTRWVLKCRVCGSASESVEAPLSPRELREFKKKFEVDHAACRASPSLTPDRTGDTDASGQAEDVP